jgi:hypothetical protein
MEDVQRILSKIVGNEISADELELVAGGRISDDCQAQGGYWTNVDDTSRTCDNP